MCKAPKLAIARRPQADVAISGRHFRFVQGTDKTYQPIASVAALTAQPLAALPPYGCGVPLAGSERLGGWQYCGTNSVAQCPQICHCEAPKGPWQSREGATSSYRASIITHKPIASVAALIERHGGWQYLRHEFYGARFPSLSFRGAKRRGNLAEPGWITWYSRRKRNCLPEIATSAVGLLAMTNLGASRRRIHAAIIASLQGAQ